MTVHGGGAPEGDGLLTSFKAWLGFGEPTKASDDEQLKTPKTNSVADSSPPKV